MIPFVSYRQDGEKGALMYKYYQPNDKDIKNQYGDCTIRALSKVLGLSWIETFDLTIPFCREYQTPNIFNVDVKTEREILDKLGFMYYGISNKKGSKRPTVAGFAKEHKKGTYILNVANHVVAVVDGIYYDTWDSGYKSLYGYYEKR